MSSLSRSLPIPTHVMSRYLMAKQLSSGDRSWMLQQDEMSRLSRAVQFTSGAMLFTPVALFIMRSRRSLQVARGSRRSILAQPMRIST